MDGWMDGWLGDLWLLHEVGLGKGCQDHDCEVGEME
jgi:hypothetical protein